MAATTDITTHGPVRWGVLGTGNIGRRAVIPAIQAATNARLVAVASRDAARARTFVHEVAPSARAHGTYEALLEDPDVEAVYIPLPNSEHAEWTIRAAGAGKHVLCEKPLALTAAEARRIIVACQSAGVLLLEAFMYRFHPQTRWVQEQLAAGRIGTVRLVRGWFGFEIAGRSRDIRLQGALGGGSLMDVGCYPLNYCRMVYGGPPQAASARVVVPPHSEVEQMVGAVLDFGEGRLGVIECGFLWPEHQRVEIVGASGRIIVEAPFTPGVSDTVIRVVGNDETMVRRIAGVDEYRLQVEHFSAAVREGKTLAILPTDAVENAAAIEMIYQAAGYEWPR